MTIQKYFTHRISMLLAAFLLCAAAALSLAPTASAAPAVTFEATNVQMRHSYVDIYGRFTNTGDTDAIVDTFHIDVNMTDANGEHLWDDSNTYYVLGIYVPAGQTVEQTFTIYSAYCPYTVTDYSWTVDYKIY